MIDEFGSGNLKRAHTTLYIELLRELGMPTEVAHYLDRIEPACFAFVNLFFWLCLRADDPSYFAGTGDRLELCFARWYPDGNVRFARSIAGAARSSARGA